MNLWMLGFEGVPLVRGEWTFLMPDYDARFSPEMRETLIDCALGAIDGTLERRVHRSRHAETWMHRLDGPVGPIVYFKVLDIHHRLGVLGRIFAASRASHVATVSEALRRDGFGVPEVVLFGRAGARGGREIIATTRVEGRMLPRFLRSPEHPLAARRAVLRALGAEIRRMHRAGYIHGDLTPYNIFVTAVEPPRFVFIDHERTRHTPLAMLERPRLRNLVQLGHFNLKEFSITDRMRVWRGYATGMLPRHRRRSLRRLAAMLRTRVSAGGHSTPSSSVSMVEQEVGQG